MASADFSQALTREISPGKVPRLSARAARALPDASFGDRWISRSLARSSPAPGLTACSCSCGRAFAPRFFQVGLAASPLRFTTVVVTLSGYLLSGHKSWPMLGTLGSALTADIDVPRGRSPTDMAEGIPVTYVPARNTIFLSFALAWAEVLGAADIFIGVNALDYSGYPDCRPEYIEAYQRMANLATQGGRRGANEAQNPYTTHPSVEGRHYPQGHRARCGLRVDQQLLRPFPRRSSLRRVRLLLAEGERFRASWDP